MEPNSTTYDASFGKQQIQNGHLIQFYSGGNYSRPSGLSCTLPIVGLEPDERRMNISFLGGGSTTSQSIFVSYAVGPGEGLCLPSFGWAGNGNAFNDRTGYIIQFQQRGDGSGAILIHRNDTGWTNQITLEHPLEFNPTMSLRHLSIVHERSGRHSIRTTFENDDISFSRFFTFEDNHYPPNNSQRVVQVSGKGKSGVIKETLEIRIDTWTVEDISSGTAPIQTGISDIQRRLSAMGPGRGSISTEDRNQAAEIARRAKEFLDQGNIFEARSSTLAALSVDPSNDDALYLMGTMDLTSEQLSDAHIHFSQSLQVRRRIYGPNHLKVAECLERLADLYQSRDLISAENYFDQALAIKEKLLGPDDVEVVTTLRRFARVYVDFDHSRAESLLRKALTIQQRGEDTELFNILYDLGDLYSVRQKRHADAERVCQRSLKIAEKNWGMESSEVVKVLMQLEVIYEKLNDSTASENVLRRLIDLVPKFGGHHHTYTARRMNNLAAIYNSRKQYVDAERMYIRAKTMWENAITPEYVEVATVCRNLAVVYVSQGKNDQAEKYFLQAIDINEKTGRGSSPSVAKYLFELGTLYANQRRFQEAEDKLRKALSIYEKTQDKEGMGNARTNLAIIAKYARKSLEANMYENKAKLLRGQN